MNNTAVLIQLSKLILSRYIDLQIPWFLLTGLNGIEYRLMKDINLQRYIGSNVVNLHVVIGRITEIWGVFFWCSSWACSSIYMNRSNLWTSLTSYLILLYEIFVGTIHFLILHKNQPQYFLFIFQLTDYLCLTAFQSASKTQCFLGVSTKKSIHLFAIFTCHE